MKKRLQIRLWSADGWVLVSRNDKIHTLTATRPNTLRVELQNWNGVRVYAKYGKFNIGDKQAKYRLEVGWYSGTAGDSLAYHNKMAFGTKDRDNDIDSRNCAVMYTGAWWYKGCHYANLNGKYPGNTITTEPPGFISDPFFHLNLLKWNWDRHLRMKISNRISSTF